MDGLVNICGVKKQVCEREWSALAKFNGAIMQQYEIKL